MAGRPPLRIGSHGKISRKYLGDRAWGAQCGVRDSDGVTRRVRRNGPPDEYDRHGKRAEDALIEALAQRRPPWGAPDQVGLDTPVMVLVLAHLDRLAEDGRAPATQATYNVVAGKLRAKVSGVRVMANVLGTNPGRDVVQIKSKRSPKGAPALSADQLRDLLAKLRASDYCREHDVADSFTVLIATGLRRGELLALRSRDFDETAGTLAVTGKVVGITGKGLIRVDENKTAAGRRTIALPRFAVEALRQRRSFPDLGEHLVIMFPSTAGTWRDPNNFGRDWRRVREGTWACLT